jgi:hypothetical protein
MFVDAPVRARVCAALLMAIVLLSSLAAAQRGARGLSQPRVASPEIGGGGGDVMGGAAYRPTNAAVAVFKDRLAELEAARRYFDKLVKRLRRSTRRTPDS